MVIRSFEKVSPEVALTDLRQKRTLLAHLLLNKKPGENKALSRAFRRTFLAHSLGSRRQQTAHRTVTDAKLTANCPQRMSLGFQASNLGRLDPEPWPTDLTALGPTMTTSPENHEHCSALLVTELSA